MAKQRIVIFGGPDGCGKTTIAKELSRVIAVPYFKPTNQGWFALHDPGMFEMQTRWGEPKLLDFLKQTGQSVIMDRGFPCDWVYSNAFKRSCSSYWSDTIGELDRGYAELDALLVFTLKRDYSKARVDGDKRIDRQMREILDRLYRACASVSECRSVLLDTDDEDLERQIGTIMEEIG